MGEGGGRGDGAGVERGGVADEAGNGVGEGGEGGEEEKENGGKTENRFHKRKDAGRGGGMAREKQTSGVGQARRGNEMKMCRNTVFSFKLS